VWISVYRRARGVPKPIWGYPLPSPPLSLIPHVANTIDQRIGPNVKWFNNFIDVDAVAKFLYYLSTWSCRPRNTE